jgi:hypothetical protein
MSRPSPSESAILYNIGDKKIGNDGNVWIITINKNGIKKWIRNNTNSNKIMLYDNKTYSLNLSKDWGKDANELIISSNKWAKKLIPIAKRLLNYGIILFIYPMGYYYIDYAEEDNIEYIKNNTSIIKYYEDFYKIKINKKNVNFYEELNKVSYIFYLATNEQSKYICLYHNLVGTNIYNNCYNIFLKYWKGELKWDKSDMKSICISLPGYKIKKEISFTQLFINKIKKDLGLIKIINRGKIKNNGDIIPTKINYGSIPTKNLEKKLKEYGLRRSNLKKAYRHIIYEDYYLIIPEEKILYINFLQGMGSRIYDNITN